MKKTTKLLGTTVLSFSLFAGVIGTAFANTELNQANNQQVEEDTEFSLFAIGDTFYMPLSGREKDPKKDFRVSIGYPNIKLYASNTGKEAFKVEVQHKYKNNRVIFEVMVHPGTPEVVINNDYYPGVPSGDYLVTIYGFNGRPEGLVELKSSNTPW